MARSTTGSRALPASSMVRESSLRGLVTWWPVASYHRARRQLPTAEARISRVPSPLKRALGREYTSVCLSMVIVMVVVPP